MRNLMKKTLFAMLIASFLVVMLTSCDSRTEDDPEITVILSDDTGGNTVTDSLLNNGVDKIYAVFRLTGNKLYTAGKIVYLDYPHSTESPENDYVRFNSGNSHSRDFIRMGDNGEAYGWFKAANNKKHKGAVEFTATVENFPRSNVTRYFMMVDDTTSTSDVPPEMNIILSDTQSGSNPTDSLINNDSDRIYVVFELSGHSANTANKHINITYPNNPDSPQDDYVRFHSLSIASSTSVVTNADGRATGFFISVNNKKHTGVVEFTATVQDFPDVTLTRVFNMVDEN